MKKVTGLTKRITAMLLSGMLIIGPTSGSVLAVDIQEDVVSETVVEDVESDVSVADQESEDAEAEDSDAEEDADKKIEADEFKNSNLEENVSQEEGKDNAEAKSLSKENVAIEEEENSVGKTQETLLLDELDQEEALTEEKGKQTAPGNREDSTDIDIISDSSRKGVVSTYVLTKLATPKDLMISGTTLSWSPVENADYYYISIGVGKNGDATFTSSSTRESSYDMQADIRNLMSSAGYTDSSELTLYTEVSAETNNPDIYANSNRAKISVPLSETGLNISVTKLATPKDLMVSGTTLSWSPVENADYYCISIGVGKNGDATFTSSSTRESSYDMQADIRNLMSSAGYTDSSELTLYTEVSAETHNPDIYANSNRAKISVPLSETGLNISTTKLATPKNLTLNNTVLTWDSVDNADYYYVRIYVEKDGRSYSSSAADSYPDKEMVDVAEGVHYSVSSAGYTDLDGLIITFEVKARSNREEFADSNPAKLVKEDYNGTYNPQEITPAITLSNTTFTYNGTVQKPTVTVKDGNTVLKESQDYTVEYPLGMINVGTYRVKVTFIGNYSEVLFESFTIKKAPQTITAKAASSSIAVGKTTMITTTGAQGKVTYKSSDTSVATVNESTGVVTGKKAGTVTITATAAATANYNAASRTIKITVNKVLKKPGNCHFAKWNNAKFTNCQIAWNKVDGADGYQTLLSWTDGSHASSTYTKSNVLYRNCTVHPQHVSQMKVRAFYMQNGQRKFGPWSNVEYITPSPTTLTTKNASVGSNLKMNVSWNIIYGCNGYNVFITTNPNGKWYWYQSTVQNATSRSSVITKCGGAKLKKNTRYYVRIVTRRKRNGVFCTVPMPSNNAYTGSFIIK